MKLAFAYHPGLVYQPMEADRLLESQRGLTGSEISCLMYAVWMAKRGHEVSWFGPVEKESSIGYVRILPYRDDAFATGWDAVLAWNRNDALVDATGALRILNMQMSEVGLCQPNWEATTDFFCPLSKAQSVYLKEQTVLPPEKWRLMYNGVDAKAFKAGVKIPGRVIWASSHDRGLHRVLELWPDVRAELPHAELHVFYDDGGMKRHAEINNPGWLWQELNRRARYTMAAMERLEPHGVRMFGAASRERMQKEFAQAEILAYPCEPVKMTETFGVTVLEAMACECVPVLTDADAFGELWGSSCPIDKMPYDRARYTELLLKTMVGPLLAETGRAVRVRALDFEWPALAEKLDRFITSRGAEGFASPWE